MSKAITVYIDGDKEIESVNLKPLASKLATQAAPVAAAPQPLAQTTSGSVTATYMNGQFDTTADVNID